MTETKRADSGTGTPEAETVGSEPERSPTTMIELLACLDSIHGRGIFVGEFGVLAGREWPRIREHIAGLESEVVRLEHEVIVWRDNFYSEESWRRRLQSKLASLAEKDA